ncbi:hypothetical protein V0M98_35240 (plasmid) [Pseudomonas silesiensis]|uniref:hypothetical protein n=1 Tax=Pseudomonas silesiensis TaxID=1853130 RepID=UPI0030CC19BF
MTGPDSPVGLTLAEGLVRYEEIFKKIESLCAWQPFTDVNLVSFRTDLDKLFNDLGTVRNYWVGKGSIVFIEELSGLDERLIALIGNCANQAANVPLMEVLSEHFQITSGMLKEAWDLPQETFLTLYRQVLQGAAEPLNVAATFWGSKSKPEHFDLLLKGLMVTFKTVPAIGGAVDVARMAACVSPVMRLLVDREKIPAVVEAFAENIGIISPVFSRFDSLCEQNRAATSASQKIANFEVTVRMPAEFLALLYAETQDASVKKFARNSFNDPRGHLPYTYFEMMGLRLPQELVGEMMAREKGNKMVKLIEHAIMVPGYQFFLNDEGIKRLEPADRAELIAVVARAGLAGKEYWGRAQEVMETLLTQAKHWGMEETVQRELFASPIPPEFYATYPALLTDKFSKDLGL